MTKNIISSLFIFAASLWAAAGLSAAEAPLAVDKAGSRVEIAVKTTVDSFVGKLPNYVATVTVERETGAVTAAKIAFHFSDIRTGDEKRDHDMNVWQETVKFPDSDFTLVVLALDAPGKFTAHGRLTLHGVTHELSFPVTIARAGGSLTVEGEAVVDTRLFGLPVIKKFMVLKVDPLVTVRFHLVGALPAL